MWSWAAQLVRSKLSCPGPRDKAWAAGTLGTAAGFASSETLQPFLKFLAAFAHLWTEILGPQVGGGCQKITELKCWAPSTAASRCWVPSDPVIFLLI